METTNHNVLVFKTALDKGHNPRDYSYQKEDIPTGEYQVTLDFMIWAKKVAGIDLYFTLQQTGQHIRLTAFRDPEETYMLDGTDVSQLVPGSTVMIQVELNGREKPILHAIRTLEG